MRIKGFILPIWDGESGRCSNWRKEKSKEQKSIWSKECWNVDKTSFSTEEKYSVKITPGQRIIYISTGYLQVTKSCKIAQRQSIELESDNQQGK